MHYDSETIDLEPRDLLVLYTDGVVETHNADGEQFSRNRLLSIIESQSAATPAQLIETIYQSIVDFSETHRPQDDVTILILKAEG